MSFLESLEQLLDARERIAAREHLIDQPQATQMMLVINANAPATLRRLDQATILVGAHIAHGGLGLACQFIDSELAQIELALGACGRRRSFRRRRTECGCN